MEEKEREGEESQDQVLIPRLNKTFQSDSGGAVASGEKRKGEGGGIRWHKEGLGWGRIRQLLNDSGFVFLKTTVLFQPFVLIVG